MSKWTKRFFNSAGSNRVYIVPTINGLKLFTLNFILLVMGLIYANNYLLLFNFILFGLFIISMFYTHFNLQGLTITGLEVEPGFANETTNGAIHFKNKENDSRYDLKLNFFDVETKCSFKPININSELNIAKTQLYLNKRGLKNFKRISIETTFPLNLFRSFAYFDINFEVVTYPEKSNAKAVSFDFLLKNGTDDSSMEIFEYRPGDKINSILWKKSTSTKTFVKKDIFNVAKSNVFELPNALLNQEEKEDALSKVSTSLILCLQSEIPFGLSHNGLIISDVDCSSFNLNECLRMLAKYES